MIRKRNSRVTVVAALAAVSALGLTACGPSVGGSDDPKPSADAGFEGVKPAESITFWSNHPGGSIETEKAIIDAFTKETGIKVELVTAGANYQEVSQKFQTAQNSGEVGDVVVVSDATWFANYLNDSLLPVDEVLKAAKADTGTYQETLYNDYLYDSKHFAVPYARSTPIFYYNKDHYAAAGLPDEAPKTWDEVKANGEKLIAAGVADSAFAFPPRDEYPAWSLVNLVWGFGGQWSKDWDMAPMTGDQTVQAVEFAQAAVKDGWAKVSSGDPADDFTAGAASQFIGSTGSLGTIGNVAKFGIGVGFLPGGPVESDDVVPTGGAGVAIAAKSSPEKQLAAAQFVDFLTNAKNTATFSLATGYLPVRTDADMSAAYAENPNFKVAVEQLKKTRNQDFARVLLPGGDRALSAALQDILTTNADVKSTLERAKSELQEEYDNDLAPRLK